MVTKVKQTLDEYKVS